MGNCGKDSSASQLVVAISKQVYDTAGGKQCYKVWLFISTNVPILMSFLQNVQVKYKGNSVIAQVVDSCVSCGPNDLGEYYNIAMATFHSSHFTGRHVPCCVREACSPFRRRDYDGMELRFLMVARSVRSSGRRCARRGTTHDPGDFLHYHLDSRCYPTFSLDP